MPRRQGKGKSLVLKSGLRCWWCPQGIASNSHNIPRLRAERVVDSGQSKRCLHCVSMRRSRSIIKPSERGQRLAPHPLSTRRTATASKPSAAAKGEHFSKQEDPSVNGSSIPSLHQRCSLPLRSTTNSKNKQISSDFQLSPKKNGSSSRDTKHKTLLVLSPHQSE